MATSSTGSKGDTMAGELNDVSLAIGRLEADTRSGREDVKKLFDLFKDHCDDEALTRSSIEKSIADLSAKIQSMADAVKALTKDHEETAEIVDHHEALKNKGIGLGIGGALMAGLGGSALWHVVRSIFFH